MMLIDAKYFKMLRMLKYDAKMMLKYEANMMLIYEAKLMLIDAKLNFMLS